MQIIKQLRRKKGINQSDLADAIGVSLRTIQLYEKKEANIPIKNLTKIADFFEVSIAELYIYEVNEEEGSYSKKRIISTDGNICYPLPDGKYLIVVPILLVALQDKFLENYSNKKFAKNLIKSGFVIDYFEEGSYMAFEIMGNSMNDGSINSIPNGSIAVGHIVENDVIFSALGSKNLLNSALIIICKTRIICKRFTKYNAKNQSIICNNLNDSPEYKDFELPKTEVLRIYKVIKKQV